MNNKTISPFLATIISLNIVIGGAFFLSSQTVVQTSGIYAPLVWLSVGLLLFPLMQVLATLSLHYPVSGGLYVYSAELLSPFLGFLSGCGYFLGTAAGNALIMFSFRALLQALFFPALTPLHGTAADVFLIIFFAYLNSKNIDFLGPLQTIFTILKTIPFLAVLLGTYYLFSSSNLASLPTPTTFSFIQGIPLVLFAYIGIEACCSIGDVIKDGKKNTPRVLFISLAIIVALYTVFQYLIIGIHGMTYDNPFLTIIPKVISNPQIAYYGNLVIQLAILSSYLGGFYSMFYTNNWNLYAMAKDNTVPYSHFFTHLNKFQAPSRCIMLQALLIICLLCLTHNIDLLMTMSDFGIIITYLLSIAAYIVLQRREKKYYFAGIAALLIIGYLLFLTFKNLIAEGFFLVVPYVVMLGFASLLYGYKKYIKVPPKN